MEKDTGSSLFQLNLDASNSYALRSAASWARVLGVAGCILGVCISSFFLILLFKYQNKPAYGYREEGFGDVLRDSGDGSSLGFWIFIIAGLVFIFGGVLSFLFGNRIYQALRSNDQDALDRAFAVLRNYFALRSITVIIVMFLFLLMFAAVLTNT